MKLNEAVRIILNEGVYDSIDDFMSLFSAKINSTFDMWMDIPRIRALYKLYNAGADIKSKTFEHEEDGEKLDRWIKKMEASGYQEFARQHGDTHVDLMEIIMVKKKK